MNDRTDVVTYRPVVRKDGNCKLGYGAQMTDAPDNRDSDWRGEDSRQWVKHSDYAALESLLLDARAEVERVRRQLMLAHMFSEAMGNEMRAAGCELTVSDEFTGVRNTRAERVEARAADLEDGDRRYRWLRERYLGADFNWGDPKSSVLVFSFDGAVSADLDSTLDTAIDAVGRGVK